MIEIDWDSAKNKLLKSERGVGFEDVVVRLVNGNVLDSLDHPNQARYPNQRIHVLDINGYAYLVPFGENEQGIFLKTIIPSRKATKNYLR